MDSLPSTSGIQRKKIKLDEPTKKKVASMSVFHCLECRSILSTKWNLKIHQEKKSCFTCRKNYPHTNKVKVFQSVEEAKSWIESEKLDKLFSMHAGTMRYKNFHCSRNINDREKKNINKNKSISKKTVSCSA